MKYHGFLLFFIIICCGGCFSLPDGKAPEGVIVTQNSTEKLSLKGAEERLITSLTLFTLTELPGQPVSIEAPDEVLPMLKTVFRNVSAVSGIRQEGHTARYTFKASRQAGEEWLFVILDNMNKKSVVWQDRFQIRK